MASKTLTHDRVGFEIVTIADVASHRPAAIPQRRRLLRRARRRIGFRLCCGAILMAAVLTTLLL